MNLRDFKTLVQHPYKSIVYKGIEWRKDINGFIGFVSVCPENFEDNDFYELCKSFDLLESRELNACIPDVPRKKTRRM
jgi:hypothetical protein